jgi:hypothetical protein
MQKLTREDMQSIKGGMASGWTIWACNDDGYVENMCWGADPAAMCGYEGCTNTGVICYTSGNCI